jgi:flagellar hook-associated protein 2
VTASLVSALGGGSGIDMSALASNLAIAQFAGRTDRLTSKSETLEKQISAASNLKSMLLSFSTSLGNRVRQGDLSPQPTVANSSVAKAALSGTTLPKGSYSLEVTALATSQTLASPAYTAGTSTVGSGSLTLRFGAVADGAFAEDTAHAAVDIAIAPGATLNDVATAINGKNAGITAYVAQTTDGAKLVLKGAEGAANGFVLEATETVGDEGLANLAWDASMPATDRVIASAANASFKIDGLAMTAKTNVATDAIPGVNLTLTSTNIGAPTQISFGDNTTAINSAMNDLTAALNEIAAQLRTDTDPKTGTLSRDSGALTLRRSFSSLASTVVMPNAADGSPRTLSDLGLVTQRDGTFSLDTKRLSESLSKDPRGVAAMFTTGLYGVYATVDSVSRAVSASGNPGSLAGSITRYTTQKTQISDDQTKLAERQETLRAQLVSRFAVSDTRIGNSKSTLSFLQNQIAAWNKSTS